MSVPKNFDFLITARISRCVSMITHHSHMQRIVYFPPQWYFLPAALNTRFAAPAKSRAVVLRVRRATSRDRLTSLVECRSRSFCHLTFKWHPSLAFGVRTFHRVNNSQLPDPSAFAATRRTLVLCWSHTITTTGLKVICQQVSQSPPITPI